MLSKQRKKKRPTNGHTTYEIRFRTTIICFPFASKGN